MAQLARSGSRAGKTKTNSGFKKNNVRSSGKLQGWLLLGRELDLLLLAFCSCLLTLVYHPVASAFHADRVAQVTINAALELSSSAVDAEAALGLKVDSAKPLK